MLFGRKKEGCAESFEINWTSSVKPQIAWIHVIEKPAIENWLNTGSTWVTEKIDHLHLCEFWLEFTKHLCCVIVNCSLAFLEFATLWGWKATVQTGKGKQLYSSDDNKSVTTLSLANWPKCTKCYHCDIFPWFIRLSFLVHFLFPGLGRWMGRVQRKSFPGKI